MFPKPDISQARRVLCVQPHYDDNDIAAGGTIAWLHQAGAEIFYLTATNDLMGVLDASLAEEEAAAQLRREQREAGQFIGVSEQYWLGLPDAGPYDYFALRKGIIRHIRLLRPDFVFTCDPWLPYEAHTDHTTVGRATAEAAILYGLLRLPVDPEIDAAYQPHDLAGIAFYATHAPNTFSDISGTREKKHAAIDCYRAQFYDEEMQMLHRLLDEQERACAQERAYTEGQICSHAEPLKVLIPRQLHMGINTIMS